MKVYVTTYGEYSEFTITGVWSTRELAEKYAGHPDDVMEWTVDCANGELPMVVVPQFYCRMGEDGSVEKEEHRDDDVVLVTNRGKAAKGKRYFYATSYVSAEHARKLCAERRQAWLGRKTVLGERA